MKPPVKIILTIFTLIFTCLFLIMIAVCIAMQIEYLGKNMGNEATGFFSAAFIATLLIGLPTVILWTILLKKRKK